MKTFIIVQYPRFDIVDTVINHVIDALYKCIIDSGRALGDY